MLTIFKHHIAMNRENSARENFSQPKLLGGPKGVADSDLGFWYNSRTFQLFAVPDFR